MYPLHIMLLLLKPHRKTGLTLPELGERDEHGLEPMDHLFSSPEKPSTKASISRKNDTTLSDEEDMELGESTSRYENTFEERGIIQLQAPFRNLLRQLRNDSE